jgi:hypothetical protein
LNEDPSELAFLRYADAYAPELEGLGPELIAWLGLDRPATEEDERAETRLATELKPIDADARAADYQS